MRPLLTIGMATYDDYDGVYFSLQALRAYHPEVLPFCNFLIVDNNPDSAHGQAVKAYAERIQAKYVPFTDWTGTTVKDQVFQNADSDFVLCMDCHVLFPPGALQYLVSYLRFADCQKELLQGPLIDDNFKISATHQDPVWRGDMWGTWAIDKALTDPRAKPTEIPQQGTGVFVCSKDFWPGFNPRFRGFGGEEGYIHTKTRQRGGVVKYLPGLAWMHRFHRPSGVPYKILREDKCRNYLIGFDELGLSLDPVIEHFTESMGASKVEKILQELNLRTPTASPQVHSYVLV